jgi:hypothetical protein
MQTAYGPVAARRDRTPRLVPPAVTATLLLPAAPVAAQHEPGDPVVLQPPLDERVQLVGGVRHHAGDDPAWADPRLDDSGWPVVDSLIRDPLEMPGGWPGIGWFRHRLMMAWAGMPPVLVVRAESGTVDEFLVAGPPLGTVVRDGFDELEIVMAGGDTALITSDGLVEAIGDNGEPFGYERAAALLGSLSGRSGPEVVDGTFEAVHRHLGRAPPQDDITVVALVALIAPPERGRSG